MPMNIAHVCPGALACVAVALQPVLPDAVAMMDTFIDGPKVFAESVGVVYVCEK